LGLAFFYGLACPRIFLSLIFTGQKMLLSVMLIIMSTILPRAGRAEPAAPFCSDGEIHPAASRRVSRRRR